MEGFVLGVVTVLAVILAVSLGRDLTQTRCAMGSVLEAEGKQYRCEEISNHPRYVFGHNSKGDLFRCEGIKTP